MWELPTKKLVKGEALPKKKNEPKGSSLFMRNSVTINEKYQLLPFFQRLIFRL